MDLFFIDQREAGRLFSLFIFSTGTLFILARLLIRLISSKRKP